MANNTTAGIAVIKQNIKPNTSTAGGVYGATAQSHFQWLGTFTANGTTDVTVVEPNVTANSVVIITVKTPAGSPASYQPYIDTITPGTGFTVKSVASDTSVYNYLVITVQ